MPFKLFVILALPPPFSHTHSALTSIFLSVHQRALVLVLCHLNLDLSNHTVLAIFCRNTSCFFVDQNSNDRVGMPASHPWACPISRRHPRYGVTVRSVTFAAAFSLRCFFHDDSVGLADGGSTPKPPPYPLPPPHTS